MRLPEQTDTAFFTPGVSQPNKQRPIIASVGLEKRDYRSLAEATADSDVDVKICGFSKDARAMARGFPRNYASKYVKQILFWPYLVQLYRDADIVAGTVTEKKSCAGVTSMVEAISGWWPGGGDENSRVG